MHLGLIGAGNISATHLRAAQMVPGVVVSAVYSPTSQKHDGSRRWPARPRTAALEEFLAHKPLDIVAIGSPSGVHAEQAIAAAERGLHALVEKPLDISIERVGCGDRRGGTAWRPCRRVLSGPAEAGPPACQADRGRGTARRAGAGLRTREVASPAGVLRRFELAWHARTGRRRRADEPGHPYGRSAAVAVRRGGVGIGGRRDTRPLDRSRRHCRRRCSPFATGRSASSRRRRRSSPGIRGGSS